MILNLAMGTIAALCVIGLWVKLDQGFSVLEERRRQGFRRADRERFLKERRRQAWESLGRNEQASRDCYASIVSLRRTIREMGL